MHRSWMKALVIVAAGALVSCERKEPNIELIQDMMESPAIKVRITIWKNQISALIFCHLRELFHVVSSLTR